MLTYAIGFIQNVQLICFAAVFILMAWDDRENRSLRWLACAYVAGLVYGVAGLAGHALPHWLRVTVMMEATPIAYAFHYAGVAHFLGRGKRLLWISAAMAIVSLPFYLYMGLAGNGWSAELSTLNDLILALQTTLTAWLLFTTSDHVTRWARATMGGFLSVYALVEYLRVAVYLRTGHMPGELPGGFANRVEIASGIVYVVACSILPLAFIWMMNVRLHANLNLKMLSDPLTELLNRRGLQLAGERELARYVRFGMDFALVVADLDHFKRINDTFGHAAGDMVLTRTAGLLQHYLRQTDVLGRLGGEEFVLLLAGTELPGARLLVERLRIALAETAFPLGEEGLQVTSSFGITFTGGRKGLTWSGLLNEADLALYAAKRAGRNTCRIYPEGPESALLGVEKRPSQVA
ncbi:diguanylate cyclase (GGDEF) domain-containing protein [Granulicella rosea]|uniref:diguanylate cyclase n=1 Tax=Granulicella rosea TaxID=474952 RepID=A0A239IIL2_9BACT|nr:GGDEF domain-containing protein [Granulicella rosea]SNS93088.1 diguanylate cyclase (GGDEF) domain-containing protein [Granulicella rosea]